MAITTSPQITYLSSPDTVHMGDQWYEVATLDNFWIRRRLDVFRRLTGDLMKPGVRVAEIGCGHGALVEQLSRELHVDVDGFDLNEHALLAAIKNFPSRRFYCYNVFDDAAELQGKYDWVVLFDILEHLPDPQPFLEHSLKLLAPGGQVAVNVPALQALYSNYDRVAGHQRRYSLSQLVDLMESSGLRVTRSTYWGFPYLPLLKLRQWMIANVRDDQVIKQGFAPPSAWMNVLLGWLGRCERIPQRWLGTSVMLTATKRT